MKIIRLTLASLVLLSGVLIFAQDPDETPGGAIVLPPSCGTLDPPVISPVVPKDVQGQLEQENWNTVQQAADVYSWQQMIALNWPAEPGQRGVPDRTASIGAPAPRVWETWKEEYEVYLPLGVKPPRWDAFQQLPSDLKLDAKVKTLFRRQKIDDRLDADLQAAGTRPTPPPTLTDQHGNLVRYEIRMNRIMFDFIREQQLYNGLKQAAYGPVQFPPGATIVKAAWREITEEEAPRYLRTRAVICEKDEEGRITKARPSTTRMGLVGFHIMAKAPSAPQWIWGTFEQVDNLAGPRPSFYDPQAPDRPVNQQTEAGTPNQIQRLVPIPSDDPDCAQPGRAVDNVQALNESVQKALAARKSALQYYELVTTQWPNQVESSPVQPTTVFEVLPAISANTTMESFVQLSSTCMGCHSRAGTLDVDAFSSSDFTFTLNNAKPKPENPWVIPAPTEPVTDWDRENWTLIQRGEYLTENTYEADETKGHVGAKLHCRSCHLDGGRDPAAAWWVGMNAKYDYPGTPTELPDRINRCFERSMNGTELCETGSDGGGDDTCATDTAMQSFIAYMTWIDNQFKARFAGTAANGFPQIPILAGDTDRGSRIYLQKCAVCHGLDGAGRYYDDGVYYRPALWGSNSFNSSAGMAKPQTMAAFLKSNMPFDARGQLTDQEAWDLAEFIDGMPRPGKQ